MCDVMKELIESERETRFKSTLTNVRSIMKNLKESKELIKLGVVTFDKLKNSSVYSASG